MKEFEDRTQWKPLDFERPLFEIEQKIADLIQLSQKTRVDMTSEIAALTARASEVSAELFRSLRPMQIVQLARHPNRPTSLDYIQRLFTPFFELRGDRCFGDDPALIGGVAMFEGQRVLLLAHQKGKTTREKMDRNFGMPRPEGYRKAIRLLALARQFRLPVITFVDTPGAFPGVDAEERGQAEAIARSIEMLVSLPCPILTIVIGEGGSGGALAIGVGDRIAMLSYSIYSVISPEGCSAIIWKDNQFAADAASALRLTAEENLRLGLIDRIIEEPVGGAHRDPGEMVNRLRDAVREELQSILNVPDSERRARRFDRLRSVGMVHETA